MERVLEDEWDLPTFAFQNLDYVPSGYGGILAPYIETGPGTMRAAATLMRLDQLAEPGALPIPQHVVCDLGSGDGQFLIGLLAHLNTTSILPVHGVGVDYDASFIKTATADAISAGEVVRWLTYDFNADLDDLASQLAKQGVTHVFTYLVPKQLELKTVKNILTRLWESGVSVCCHKFQPKYLGRATRSDELMSLEVYEREESRV